LAEESGDEVRYFGSHRGQESKAASEAGFKFTATEANPIPTLASFDGLRAIVTLFRSTRQVAAEFREWRPDVLFATGGYSSGPSLRAARSLHIPIVLHEQNSVPGRSTKSMASVASKICIVFSETRKHFPKERVVETGMPIRRQLVEASRLDLKKPCFTTLVAGGSQGARALNDAVIGAYTDEGEWIHVTGPALFEDMKGMRKSHDYKLVPFLQEAEMAAALSTASLAIVRAGSGTIAELALFGVPAIFVPLPTSFANHQLHNAREIEHIGGGTVIDQSQLTSEALAAEWRAWRDDVSRRAKATAALKAWSKPDAADRVFAVVKGAAA
jgi:UDP-N-acetylglucosamine--N-acetylmuramyl-(pentapeptide) pyrophosphoryl-undecaprenol N-acetylglucosamine transferase